MIQSTSRQLQEVSALSETVLNSEHIPRKSIKIRAQKEHHGAVAERIIAPPFVTQAFMESKWFMLIVVHSAVIGQVSGDADELAPKLLAQAEAVHQSQEELENFLSEWARENLPAPVFGAYCM
jgi:hypothetical protein